MEQKLEINPEYILQDMVSQRFQTITGEIKNPEKVSNVYYNGTSVDVTFTNGESLTFTVTKN